jgi:hypothetical protein
LRQLRQGLIDRHLVVARVQIEQRGADTHRLVIVYINVRNGSVDAGADRVEMGFDLRVIGAFELPCMQPVEESKNCGYNQNPEEDHECSAAPAS